MMPRHLIAAALVRLYPAAWRREYGDELLSILEARPLTPAVVADVAMHGCWHRVRLVAPAVTLGLASAVLALAGVVLTPTAYGTQWTALIEPSGITFPTIRVAFMASEWFVLMLVGCGCWTFVRRRTRIRDAVVAAMTMTLIAGLPVTIAGVLAGFGMIEVVFVGPGGMAEAPIASPWVMAAAPIFRLGESAIWGAVGGELGRLLTRRRSSAVA